MSELNIWIVGPDLELCDFKQLLLPDGLMCTLSHLLLVLLFKRNYWGGPYVPLPTYLGLMLIQILEYWM